MEKLSAAFSLCPNDTFLFHAWATGRVGKQIPLRPVLSDIQNLNEWALQEKYPLIKVSMHCFGQIQNHYQLLPVGCALGHGLGPKLVSKVPFALSQMTDKVVAIPGKDTTASLLCHLLLPDPKKTIYTTYDQIVPLIQQDKADAGIIIHETRFTFQSLGLAELADLGTLWEKTYNSPLPLGGIAVHRNLNSPSLQNIIKALQESLLCAWLDPQASASYAMERSLEKDPKVVGQHISTYVTQETFQLSSVGISAVDALLKLSREKGLMPLCSLPWMAA